MFAFKTAYALLVPLVSPGIGRQSIEKVGKKARSAREGEAEER